MTEEDIKNKPTVGNVGKAALQETKYFEAVLNDGERIKCKLLQYGTYELLVDAEFGKILLPKHAVKYFVIEKYDDDSKQ